MFIFILDKPDTIQLSKAADEWCEEARTTFQFAIGMESPEKLVFTDESAIDLRTTYRLMGWAYQGECAHIRAKFVRGDRYAVPHHVLQN